MLAGSHRNAWPDETGTGGRTNRNTQGFTPALKADFLPDSIRSNPVSYPPPEQLRRSEFYNPDVSSNELRTTIYFSVLK